MSILTTLFTGMSEDAFLADNVGESSAYYFPLHTHLLLVYPDSGDYYAYFRGVMPQNYAGGTIRIHLIVTTEQGAAGIKPCYFHIAIQRHELNDPLGNEDYGTEIASAYRDAFDSRYGPVDYIGSARDLDTAAKLDGITAGDMFTLRIRRDGTYVDDILAETAYLVSVQLYEVFA